MRAHAHARACVGVDGRVCACACAAEQAGGGGGGGVRIASCAALAAPACRSQTQPCAARAGARSALACPGAHGLVLPGTLPTPCSPVRDRPAAPTATVRTTLPPYCRVPGGTPVLYGYPARGRIFAHIGRADADGRNRSSMKFHAQIAPTVLTHDAKRALCVHRSVVCARTGRYTHAHLRTHARAHLHAHTYTHLHTRGRRARGGSSVAHDPWVLEGYSGGTPARGSHFRAYRTRRNQSFCCASRLARSSTRDATAAVAVHRRVYQRRIPRVPVPRRRRMHEGHAAQVGLGMQGEGNKKTKGWGGQGGGSPQRKGGKGVRG